MSSGIKKELCRVERLLEGCFIMTTEGTIDVKAYVCYLHKFRLWDAGTLKSYKGESYDEIGLKVGSLVVAHFDNQGELEYVNNPVFCGSPFSVNV